LEVFLFKKAALLHFDTDVHGVTGITIRASTPDGDPRRTRGVRLQAEHRLLEREAGMAGTCGRGPVLMIFSFE
jgi:hypothetical protein